MADDEEALAATTEEMLPYIMSSVPEEVAISAGYTVSEVIISCTYGGIQCSLGFVLYQ